MKLHSFWIFVKIHENMCILEMNAFWLGYNKFVFEHFEWFLHIFVPFITIFDDFFTIYSQKYSFLMNIWRYFGPISVLELSWGLERGWMSLRAVANSI